MLVLEAIVDPGFMDYLMGINKIADFSCSSFILSSFQNLSFDPMEIIQQHKQKYTLCFSSKKKFNDELTISITQPLNELGQIYHQVEKVLGDSSFLEQNFKKFDSLTRREREIMGLIAKGTTSEQIAEQLFISPHTVNKHRKNIWKKLDIKSYLELIPFAEHFDLL